jgi:hypothetical protein
MKTIPVIVPSKSPQARAKKPRADQSASPKVKAVSKDASHAPLKRNLLHDLVNQLTIIRLACFELRRPEGDPWNECQRKAIDAIETAVQNAGELAVQLTQTIEVNNSKKANATRDCYSSRILPAYQSHKQIFSGFDNPHERQ